MKFSTNEFKNGMKILIEGEPCSIISSEFHKPGKGQAVVRTKLFNLKTEKVWERTFKSGESVDAADILESDYQYLYKDGENFIFMNQDDFNQIEISKEKLLGNDIWLNGEEVCKIVFWNNEPLKIEPPNFVEKQIISTEPGLKGDTVSNTLKPAIIPSGKEVHVPLFIEEGDVIKIDTRNGTYVGKASKK